jgi:RND family efflux transporter MFP subunit
MEREPRAASRLPLVRRWLRALRRPALVLLLLVAAAAAAAATWQARQAAPAPNDVAQAPVTRGDVVVSVGGVGRIVEARAAEPIGVPSQAGGASTTTPADAVFATATGHLVRFTVGMGAHVRAGQRIAVLDDGGTTTAAVLQARSDYATAQVELAQRLTTDPAKGLPPTAAELAAARDAVTAARTRLALLLHPAAADIATARVDVRKAWADLATLLHRPSHTALAAAKLAVRVATRRLAQARAPALPADVTAARLDLAKAESELELLQTAPRPPAASAIAAAQAAVDLAQKRLAELPPDAPPSDVAAAQLDLKKAQADLDALTAAPVPPTATAIEAAQLAVELARERLARLLAPPSAVVVGAARADLRKAQADLKLLQQRPSPTAVRAARVAVTAATRRLALVRHPTTAARDAARADLAKAVADLATLRKRGAPASAGDVSLARLKLRAAAERLAAARYQQGRLIVRAPSAGTVTALLTVPGAPVDASTPIATVADLRHLAVRVDLSEFDAARVHRGQVAFVRVDALGGRPLRGKVLSAAFTGTDAGGVVTFPVQVSLRRLPGIKPGMNASVRIVIAAHRHVLRVPLEAVALDGRRKGRVSVVDGSGNTVVREVRLGLADNTNVEIRHGLRPGERVTIAGNGGDDA